MILMENKILIKLIIPEFDKSYDLFIPVSITVYKLKCLLFKSIEEITHFNLLNSSCTIMNKVNSRIYNNNEIVINTDIRNATELILLFNN